MKTISLTRGLFAQVDDADFENINQFKWQARRMRKGYDNWYASRGKYNPLTKKNKTVLMHREILDVESKVLIDHNDGDGLNNQKANLRIATHSENSMNQKSVRGYSKYRGVYFHKQNNNWRAQITIDQNKKMLGSFKTEEDAALAYDQAAEKYFGEFAVLNFTKTLLAKNAVAL